MKKIFITLLAIVSGIQLRAQSADDIIKEYVKAIGGSDKIQSVQNMKATGNVQQGGMEFPFTMYQKRPNMMLIESTFQGKTMKQGFDGTIGWGINPFMGRENAEKMDADEMKQIKLQADIDGPLVNYAAKGNKVESAGVEDIDGSPCYHIKLTSPESDLYDFYFDKDSYLIVKLKSHVKMQDGSTVDAETNYSDYKEVNGVLIPFTIENVGEFQGQQMSSFIKIDKVEQNVAMDDAMFRMPDAVASPTK